MAGIQIPEAFTVAMDTAMNGLIVVINDNDAHSCLIKKIAPPWQKETPCTDEFAKYLDGIEVPDHLKQAHGLLVVLAYTQYLLTNMEYREVSLAKSFDLLELITFIGRNAHKLFGVMSGFKKAVNGITNNLQKLTDWSIDVDSMDMASFEQQLNALTIYQKLVTFIVNHKTTDYASDVVTQVRALDNTKTRPKIPFIHERIKRQLEEIAKAAEAAAIAEKITSIEHSPLLVFPGTREKELHRQQLDEMDTQITRINNQLVLAMRGTFDDTKKTETEIEALSEQLEKLNVKKREIEKQTSIRAQFSMKLATMAIVTVPSQIKDKNIEPALSALSEHAHNLDNQQWLSIIFNGSNHLMSAFLATEIHDLVAYKNVETNSFYFKSQDGNLFIAIEMPEGTEGSKITFDEILGSEGVTVQVYISPDLIRKRIGALKTRKQALAEVLIATEAEAREANKFVDSDTESDESLSSTEVRAEADEDEDVFYDAVEEADEDVFYDAVEEAAEQRITNAPAPAPAPAAEVPTPAPTLEAKAEATEQQERANQRAEAAEQRTTNAPAALAAKSAKTNPTMITGSIAFELITIGLMIAGAFTGGVGFILGAAVAAYISGLCGSETASNSQPSLQSYRQ